MSAGDHVQIAGESSRTEAAAEADVPAAEKYVASAGVEGARPDGPHRPDLTRELVGVPGALLVLTVLLRAPLSGLRPRNGTDASWILGINTFRQYSLHFGPQLIYTYGPWGSVDYPLEISRTNLLAAQLFAIVAATAVWVGYYLLCRRLTGPVVAALLCSLIVLISLQGAQLSAALLVAGVAVGISYLAGRADGRMSWVPAVVAATAAFLVQVKFSEGIALSAIAAVCVACAPGHRLRRAAEAAAGWLLVTVVAWVAAGQSLTDYPNWFAGATQVARGYTDAMALEVGPTWRSYLLMAVLTAFIAGFASLRFRHDDRGAAVGATLVAAIALYLGLKEATTRHGVEHDLYFYLLAVPVLLGFLSLGRKWYLRGAVLALTVLLASSPWSLTLNPATVGHRYLTTARLLTDSSYRDADLAAAKLAARRTYAISPSMQRAIADKPIAVDTVESSIAWAFDLKWSPAPVFQTYVAYTAELDRRNAAAIKAAPANQRILRSVIGAIDGRNALWDSPRYVLSEVCNYRAVQTDARWLLLAKATDRCSKPTAVGGELQVRAGQAVPVPVAGANQVVLMSFRERDPGALIRLGRLLDKSYSPLRVTAAGRAYRLPRPLADGPLIVRLPTSAGWTGRFLTGSPYSSVSFNEAGTVSFRTVTLPQ